MDKNRSRRRGAVALSLGLAVLSSGAASCRSENPAQMLETAKFEEVQFNEAHARVLYERIIAEYPNSEQAQAARARLAELDAAADED